MITKPNHLPKIQFQRSGALTSVTNKVISKFYVFVDGVLEYEVDVTSEPTIVSQDKTKLVDFTFNRDTGLTFDEAFDFCKRMAA